MGKAFEKIKFLPGKENIFLHARIKGLKKKSRTYQYISLKLLERFCEASPKNIFVPTFTYSFTKRKIFKISSSPSEVGRFSEDIRNSISFNLRTLDPVFSVLDVLNSKLDKKKLIKDSFGKNSIFEKFDKINGIVVNVGLDQIFSTQFHYYEKMLKVPYRSNRFFKGKVFDHYGNTKIVNYKFYSRDLEESFAFNRKKIRELMLKEKILHESTWENLPVRWFRTEDLKKMLIHKFKNDNYFLVTK